MHILIFAGLSITVHVSVSRFPLGLYCAIPFGFYIIITYGLSQYMIVLLIRELRS